MKNKKGAPTVPTLDLHGFLVDEVYDAIDHFLRDSERKGHARVRIITGKGSGKVRAETLSYLKTAHYNPQQENEGSFLVVL
ncbi:Smr/MutS family protein [Bdellovibrionota bacterium FG-2]